MLGHGLVIYAVFLCFEVYMSLHPKGIWGYEPSGIQILVPVYFVLPCFIVLPFLMLYFARELKINRLQFIALLFIGVLILIPLTNMPPTNIFWWYYYFIMLLLGIIIMLVSLFFHLKIKK